MGRGGNICLLPGEVERDSFLFLGGEVDGDLFREELGIPLSKLLDELAGFLISRVLFSGMKESAWKALLEVAGSCCAETAGCFFLINGDFFREEFGIIQSNLLGELSGFPSSVVQESAWTAGGFFLGL